jgi:hypothetical protein
MKHTSARLLAIQRVIRGTLSEDWFEIISDDKEKCVYHVLGFLTPATLAFAESEAVDIDLSQKCGFDIMLCLSGSWMRVPYLSYMTRWWRTMSDGASS